MNPRLLCAIFVGISFLCCSVCGLGAGRNFKEKEYGLAFGYLALTLLFSDIFLVTMVIGMFI